MYKQAILNNLIKLANKTVNKYISRGSALRRRIGGFSRTHYTKDSSQSMKDWYKDTVKEDIAKTENALLDRKTGFNNGGTWSFTVPTALYTGKEVI